MNKEGINKLLREERKRGRKVKTQSPETRGLISPKTSIPQGPSTTTKKYKKRRKQNHTSQRPQIPNPKTSPIERRQGGDLSIAHKIDRSRTQSHRGGVVQSLMHHIAHQSLHMRFARRLTNGPLAAPTPSTITCIARECPDLSVVPNHGGLAPLTLAS